MDSAMNAGPILFRDFPEEWKSIIKHSADYPYVLNIEFGYYAMDLLGMQTLGPKSFDSDHSCEALTALFYAHLFRTDYKLIGAAHPEIVKPFEAIKLKLTQHFEALVRLINPQFNVLFLSGTLQGEIYPTVSQGKERATLKPFPIECLVLPKIKHKAKKKQFRLNQLKFWNP
jgi:hypothetical protein